VKTPAPRAIVPVEPAVFDQTGLRFVIARRSSHHHGHGEANETAEKTPPVLLILDGGRRQHDEAPVTMCPHRGDDI
jgi:hypothetical protein